MHHPTRRVLRSISEFIDSLVVHQPARRCRSGPRLDASEEEGFEAIRSRMLQAARSCSRAAGINSKITCAGSVTTLWFLRPELMLALAIETGESAARAELNEITELFAPFGMPH